MPDISENTPQRDLIIASRPFKVPAPYAAGHALTENEASAFNNLFAENLRNNFAAKIKKDDEAAEAAKTEKPTLEALQAELTAYAETYEFGVRRTASGVIGTSTDPVERELHKMAREIIKARLKEKGYKLKSIQDEIIQGLVESLIESRPAMRDEAQRRLENLKNLESTKDGEDEIDLSGLTATQSDTAQPDAA